MGKWDLILPIFKTIEEDCFWDKTSYAHPLKEDVFRLLEKNCIVVYYPLDNEETCGFHIKRYLDGERKDFVYINTSKPLSDQVFTAAHELGHVWGVDRKVKEQLRLKKCEEYPECELLVNRFAAELIMPREHFIKCFLTHSNELKIKGLSVRIEDLTHIIALLMIDFMVPYVAVRKRLVEVSIIGASEGEKLAKLDDSLISMAEEYIKGQNTVADNPTQKKAIPGLRGIVEKLEAYSECNEYLVSKIKSDFALNDIVDHDESISILPDIQSDE